MKETNAKHKRYYFYRTCSSKDKIEYYSAWSDGWTEDFLHAHFTADIELVRLRAKGWAGLLKVDSPGMKWVISIGAVDISDNETFTEEIS